MKLEDEYRRRDAHYILLIIFVLFAWMIAACEEYHESKPQSVNTPTQKLSSPVTHATLLPKPTPNPQPTHSYTEMTSGPTVLGVSVSNFFGAYGGALLSHDHGYTWLIQRYGITYEWIVADIHSNGKVYRVNVINQSQTNWSMEQSAQTCGAFLPKGSSFEEQVDDDQIAYYTSSLGEIQLWRQNEEGDCLLQFKDTIGADNWTFAAHEIRNELAWEIHNWEQRIPQQQGSRVSSLKGRV